MSILTKVLQIYKFAEDYGIDADSLLVFEGIKRSDYDALVSEYVFRKPTETTYIDDDKPREYECYRGRYLADSVLI